MSAGLNRNGFEREMIRMLGSSIEALAASINSELVMRLLLLHGLAASAKFTGERREYALWGNVFSVARPAWRGEIGAEQVASAFDPLWDHLRSAAHGCDRHNVDAWTAIGATLAALAAAQLVMLRRISETEGARVPFMEFARYG